MVTSIFFVGNTIGLVVWGVVADVWGRRRCLLSAFLAVDIWIVRAGIEAVGTMLSLAFILATTVEAFDVATFRARLRAFPLSTSHLTCLVSHGSSRSTLEAG